MQTGRQDGLIFVVLGALVFVLLGVAMEQLLHGPLTDFKGIYYPSRTLLEHGDPYNPDQVLRVYRAESGARQTDNKKTMVVTTVLPYLPSVFVLSVPFALLPWKLASGAWVALTAASLIFAAWLAWDLSRGAMPVLSGVLIGFLLAGSEVLLVIGNAAGLIVALCVLAVWCFMERRFESIGVLCLALALAVKPQDAGFIWLYFLLAEGRLRKRALQTLGVVGVIAVATVVWVSRVSPLWRHELAANLATHSQHGGLADPGPASLGAHGMAMIVNLQAVFSVFRDDAHFYNLVTYFVCAVLIAAWIFVTIRMKYSPLKTWLGLSVIAGLTMLPTYHRQYDTKLLLLTIPACALLWAEGTRAGRIAVMVNAATIVLNSDLTWAVILGVVHSVPVQRGGIGEHFMVGLQVFPAPLSLLASSMAFLYVYVRSGSREDGSDSIVASKST